MYDGFLTNPPSIRMAHFPVSLTSLIIFVGLLYLPWLHHEEEAEQSVRDKMTWIPVSNSSALCNDFTKAGFFIRQNHSSKNWILFLEGGGLCSDVDSCNQRFFVSEVRVV